MLALVALVLVAAPSQKSWNFLTAGGQLATLTQRTTVTGLEVEWRVDNNGRGAKLKHVVQLDKAGLITRHDITGTGDAGAGVEEHFTWANGLATWSTRQEHGEARTTQPYYLDASGSPWVLTWYVHQLLERKQTRAALLPSGELKLEKLREVKVGREALTLYAVSGPGFTPVFMLMRGAEFVAQVAPGEALVEQSLSAHFDALQTIGTQAVSEYAQRLSQRVTHPIDGPLWLTHVRVFDSVRGVVDPELVNVVVFRGEVTQAGPDAPPAGAKTFDGQGGTLLPGLCDAHAHLTETDGLLHIASGVTFVREVGNDNDSLLRMVAAFDDGTLVGPRSWRSGFIEGRSPFSAQMGKVVSSVDEAKSAVRWYAERGYWGVKLYNSMTPEWVKPVAEEAHRLGLHVSGHVPAFMTSERAIRDGYDEVNHVNQLLLGLLLKEGEDTRTPFRFTAIGDRLGGLDLKGAEFQRLLALMKERKTTLDPTMGIFSRMFQTKGGRPPPSDLNYFERLPPSVKRDRSSPILEVPAEKRATWDASFAKLEEALVMLHREGVPLVPGTDDWGGLALHSELEAWVRAGIPANEALRSATLGCARLLGQEARLGRIGRGRPSDLYLVDGDPTKDITTLRRGLLVVKGNATFVPDEVLGALNVAPWKR